MDCDVEDRDGVDGPLEPALVRVAVQDEIRTVRRERNCQPLVPEHRPDPAWLALERLRDRRVVEQRDPDCRAGDLGEAVIQRLDVRRRRGIDLADHRLAEVDPAPVEAADEPLRTDDADGNTVHIEHRRRALEHRDPGSGEQLDDLSLPVRVVVVVPEHRDDRRLHGARDIGEHLRLLWQPVRRQIAGEQDHVGIGVDLLECGLDVATGLLAAVDVRRSSNPDSSGAHAGILQTEDVSENDQFEAIKDSLKKAAAALQRAEVPFMLGGGLATWVRGAPGSDHDLDLLVKPEDAERALEVLAEEGMRPEKPPENWLYKAWDGDVMVDLIFSPSGDEISDENFDRAEDLEVNAVRMPVAALEDVIATKLLALGEHEADFGPVLEISRAVREQVDWDQVRARTASSPFAKAFFTLAEELGVVEPAPSVG
jgi:hypothetical protein